jgi:PAS domain S-box-containing protein
MLDGTICYSNVQFASLIQIPLEKLIGHKLKDFILTEDLERFQTILDRGFQGKCKCEVSIKSVDGTIIPIIIKNNTKNDFKGVYIVNTDLSEETYYEKLQTQHDNLLNVNQALKKSIKEHRKTEELLLKSEEMFSKVFHANPAPIALTDEYSRFIDVNDSFLRLTGYSKDELIGHTSLELNIIIPEEGKQDLNKLQEKDSIQYEELEITTKSGEKRIVVINYELIKFQDNKINFILFIYDITERKQAELMGEQLLHELQDSQRLLQADLDVMGRLHKLSALFLHEDNIETLFEEIVDTAIAICGSDFGSIQLLDPESFNLKIVASRGLPKPWLDYWNQVSEGQGSCGTALNLGERVIVEDVTKSSIFVDSPALDIQLNAGVRAVISTPIISRSGNLLGMFSTHYKTPHHADSRELQFLDLLTHQTADIIDKAQYEEELTDNIQNLEEIVDERTHELFLAYQYNRNMFEITLDPLVTIDPNGKIMDANKATEITTGLSRKELTGTDFSGYFSEPENAIKGYKQVFRDGIVRDYPLEIRHVNGSITPVLYNASVYKDEYGEVIGVFAAARDITELKKAEEELKEYWENLEEEVRLRTEELAKSNADLKQFAYVASHDLREPLRMISSFLQLLERRYGDQLDEDAYEFINFAVDGAKRLDLMIMDLLEYSRVANKEIEFSKVDFEEVIQQTILNLEILIKENNAQITYDSLPIIWGDEYQMVILLQNLIANAIKYRQEEPPKIHISTEKRGDKFVFSVKDNGIGIDSQHLERIFTIFQRLHTHDKYEGTGIGLSIAQRVVHQHNGEMWVESEPEKGSTFYFTLPAN